MNPLADGGAPPSRPPKRPPVRARRPAATGSRSGAAVVAALTALALLAVLFPGARPARAASLEKVTGFGSNPGGLTMWVYRPDGMPQGAPAVVALHGCTQTANDYFANSGWRKFADLHRFALILPERIDSTAFPSNCFQWYQEAHIRRGQGAALSIAQMVGHAVGAYGLDPARISVTGLSAGGAMAAVMLATYPDLFQAGSVVAGLPYRCSPPALSSTCMSGPVSKTPAQWGDLVRAAHPGYAGPRPRVAVWHGQADYVVNTANGTELRDQFTDVLGTGQTPTSTESLPAGTTLERYGGDAVRFYKVAGMGHGTPVDPGGAADQCGTAGAYFLDTICSAYHDTRFFGLDGAATPSPSPSATPSPSPSASPSPSPSPSASPSPSPSPTGSPDPTPGTVCVTASNYAHTTAGRAHQSGGYTYANGSNDAMGLWNVFVTHTLRQTGPNHWVLADGQC
ncbi:extracellular catalytic domain type 1 short-chain-length polyhydroxyalkanoate depolymerase [Microtetraspora niveoalba]|uniref:extracellular catalytic domain type 1 short-chain-length polyhydroxyalkanoate depolymerase n=1 Tax=Microtetraspora niveoalba TaxID=46175 RepID=UPI000A0110F6|nr:PHB depolymerase family esterase [Microtetraspora niveoalba]